MSRQMFSALEDARRIAEHQETTRRGIEALAGLKRSILVGFEKLTSSGRLFEEARTASRTWQDQVATIASTSRAMAEAVERSGLARLAFQDQARDLAEQLSGVGAAAKLIESRFRLPDPAELTGLRELMRPLEMEVEPFRVAMPRLDGLSEAMERIRAPWVSIENPLASLQSAAELARLGEGLASLGAYSRELTDTLRVDLGDWRRCVAFDVDRILDSAWRHDLYKDLGFDRRLTDFPPAAFGTALDFTGIRPRTPPPLAMLEALRADEGEEDHVPGENLNAYEQIYRLEERLRSFIQVQMERLCGPRWISQRVDSEARESWKRKKAESLARGEEDRPLIAYADFTDYVRIITRRDNWSTLFEAVFVRKESVQESFARLHPVRICTMHSRPLTQDDLLLLYVEVRRLLKAMDSFEG